MKEFQKTLKKEYTFTGKGLHSGRKVEMAIAPAPENTGIRFYRKDMGPDVYIDAIADYVTFTQRGTTLEKGDVKICTMEHLLSTFYALGVNNAYVTLNSFEAPILDGSALPYVQAIVPDGLLVQKAPVEYFDIKERIDYKDEKTGSEITILPAEEFSVDLSIDYNSKVLGIQRATFDHNTDYVKEIAPCRTFVFFHELEYLYNHNLIKGGDLENAIVIVEHAASDEEISRLSALFNVTDVKKAPEGYLDNVKLHFKNECARHKLLDLLGDFSLIGYKFNGKVIAEKSGHKINTDMAKILRKKFLQGK